ncbi:WD40-repeat-containing domain protein [Cantharellus anzutake]|uniref:WD40-repeat-containing domain protein n=1 Tax=Cantharellus anzutake TaxID=1750568 RepID=UPI001902E47B|nr:WD40-repeat-containing domain protein [Cantharellus anzutake]KAF8328351.1 WD40-repeat-containing domain protein [Cantharellus anzutake]
MRFTKPAWVVHQETSDKKKLGIFSISVHPDGSRIATGGLDSKIRIWSTLPILRPEYDDSIPSVDPKNAPSKSLCTLSMHAGPVLVVRWSHSGKWLASGSDDTIIMIWDLDLSGGGKVWGTDETNIEGWKALKRLPGHDSDVTDLAFSPGDRYLASVGLDSKVLIWNGATLELIRMLDGHQGYVKGVCWDPVGQYLATQSDDKSAKIWNTTDWKLETSITQPFEKSPGSTFFRRLSWSPDGAHITASNAMNNNGYVFVAAVISRSSWSSNISLVGHENTVEVAAYNPHIFRRDPDLPVTTANICSVVALGCDDLSISIWQTKSARPLIVAKDAFERPVMDLSWSLDGMTLYACSSDGTIGVFDFDASELEGIAPLSVQADYLKLFNFTAPPEDTPNLNMSGKKKRRIKPVFVSHLSGLPNGTPIPNQPSMNGATPYPSYPSTSQAPQPFGAPQLPDPAPSAFRDPYTFAASQPPGFRDPTFPPYHHTEPERFPSHSSSFAPSQVPQMDTIQNASRANSLQNGDHPDGSGNMWDSIDGGANHNDTSRLPKARTLGGDRRREPMGPIKDIRPPSVANQMNMSPSGSSTNHRLAIPAVRNIVFAKVEDRETDVFEGRNSENGSSPSEVSLISAKQTQFLDYVSAGVLAVTATSVFCAAALEDGSINVYSPTGRRLMPSMLLDSPCVSMNACKQFLMAITSSAHMYIWDMKKQKAHVSAVLIRPLISSHSSDLSSAMIRPNGAPVLTISAGAAFTYDISLQAWLRASEARWAEGSDAWEGKQRPTANRGSAGARGVVSSIEAAISDLELNIGEQRGDSTPWWNAALTLGHLETRLHAAKLFDSPSEYKSNLHLYAKRLAEEGFRAKAEELMKELCGPLYWKPGRDDLWCPTIMGMQKRELLKDVAGIFARSKTFAKLGQDWQELMKKIHADS